MNKKTSFDFELGRVLEMLEKDVATRQWAKRLKKSADELKNEIRRQEREKVRDEYNDALLAGYFGGHCSVGLTDDIEELREIAVTRCNWWNYCVVPLLARDGGWIWMSAHEASNYSLGLIESAVKACRERHIAPDELLLGKGEEARS